MVLHLQPQKQQRVCFLVSLEAHWHAVLISRKGLEKYQKKALGDQKSVLHLQPEKH